MKNKNGYTLIELIILLAVLGVATLITVASLSYAFDDGTEAIVESEVAYMLDKAVEYGEEVINDVKDSGSGLTITVAKLVEKGYLFADENGNVTDSTKSKKIYNAMKIKIIYNEKTDSVTASVIE